MSDSTTSEKSSKSNSAQPAGGNPPSSGNKPPKKLAVRITIKDIVEEMRRGDHHFAKGRNGGLYHYDHGVYRPRGEEVVRKVVTELFQFRWGRLDEWTSHYTEEAIRYYQSVSDSLWEPQELDPDIINLRNGLLDVQSLQLSSHSSRYLSMVQLPVNYDPSAECPAWEKFLGEVWPPDSLDLFWEIAAWMMTPWNAIQQAIILCGTGRNGKGRLIAGLTAFLGPENVTTMALDEIEGNRFSKARLYGKLANLAADIKGGRLSSSGAFKSITGGDMLTGEEKHKTGFEFKPSVKLGFSLNEPFKSDDTSYGFMRRLLGIPFSNFFEKGTAEDQHKLDAALADPGELSGLLNKALAALPQLRQDMEFHYGPLVKEATRELRHEVDPLRGIIEPIFEDDPDRYVLCGQAYEKVKNACLAAGCPVPSMHSFGRTMKQIFPRIQMGKRKDRLDEDRWKKAYLGIGWVIAQK